MSRVHRTVKITRKFLTNHHACKDGLKRVGALLPATLSTDPEANIELALQLAEIANTYQSDVWWLAVSVTPNGLRGPDQRWLDTYVPAFTQRSGECEPLVLMQQLAMIADTLSIKQGK